MWYEGFDYVTANTNLSATVLATLWANTYGYLNISPNHQSNGFPTGSRCSLRAASGGGVPISPIFAFGHEWYHSWVSKGNNDTAFITFYNGGVAAMSIFWDSDNLVYIKRGAYSGTTLAVSATTLNVGEHILTIYLDLDNGTAGNVYVFVDKSTTPFVSATQTDTTNAATAGFNQIGFGSSSGSLYVDDVCVLTEAEKQAVWGIGASVIAPPALPTNVPAQELFMPSYVPSASSSVQWAPLSGSNHQNVDSNPIVTTEFNTTSALEQKDLFTFSGIGFTPTRAVAVKVTTYAAVDGTITGVANAISSGGNQSSDTLGQSRGAAGVYALRDTFFGTTKPGGGAWDVATINALQFGYISRNS